MHSVFEMKGSNGQVVKGNKWIVSEEVKQVVVLSHGMNEYTYRYNDFALYLNDNGINVMGLDHIGHGLNVDNTEDLLKWPKNGFDICVDNFAKYTKEELISLGVNDSMIHVDFMIGTDDLEVTGITEDGTQVAIFRNGDWVF